MSQHRFHFVARWASHRFTTLLALGGAALLGLHAEAETLLLTGATVHTITGETFAPGQVLIRDGKIAAVGASLTTNEATRVDLSGQHLYPGFILLDTTLGLTEIAAIRGPQDNPEVGEYTPDVESWVAVNPDSELIPVGRANGVAYFEAVPQGGIVAGQSGLLAMDGWTFEQMTVRQPVALHVYWPSQELDTSPPRPGKAKAKSLEDQAKERFAKRQSIDEFFRDAQAYAQAKRAADAGHATAARRVPAWEAMLPYIRGERPFMVHADEIRQIRAAVDWALTNHYPMTLVGGRDAWMAADLLASNKIAVVYTHTFTQPTRETESYDVHFGAPEKLRRAGVTVAFSVGTGSFDAAQARNLPYAAAQAVAFGLPEAEALKGLTIYPAQLAGMADQLGSISPGKVATLFSADGNILDIRSKVKHLWIAGRDVSLANRHTRLYEKYQHRPRSQ